MDAALFRTVAALANHKPPTQCNAGFTAVYPYYAIVATKDIRSGRQIYVDYKMHGAGSPHHVAQPKSQKKPTWCHYESCVDNVLHICVYI